ncbi:carboxymuconolactone decarboxylase family protein [Methylovulum psychrotolerans]|uniref:Peroxidase n=1 Tax=Methylovulum psychrotolerans TaxID=1704499 RepID=A0A1Z4C109_9GAMM|nr:peroxidase-related enzyme [Methylovulum psychrotolerans]ASF47213.1 peroxidase [Methylovulum psychrotolerans]MBT9099678.1 peroxidase-related enzyme [Methylovulum psychrotolerans]POZ50461.1 peroxidase [Methylovulum psychrotolerans]
MSRINTVTKETADAEQQALFTAIQAKLGMVPNFLKILANSPAALRAFLGLHSIANEGSLDPQTRERIALAVAQQNACDYCVSAHTAIGRKAGLDNAEIHANRSGTSHDAKAAVAVKFARSLLENSGEVTTAEIIEARAAGFSDADLVEIITHVAMNIFTNMIGKASHVDIDFPKIDLKLVA